MPRIGVVGAAARFCGLFALLVAGVAQDVTGDGLAVGDAALTGQGDFVQAAAGA